MQQLITALLLIVSSMQRPWYRDGKNPETPEEYSLRAATIVETIAQVTESSEGWGVWSHKDRAALLFGQTRQESGFWKYEVHAGTERGDKGKSICLGQIHQQAGLPREEWEALGGLDREATRRCLQKAWEVFTKYRAACPLTTDKPTLAAAGVLISGYGNGGSNCKVLKKFEWRAREWNRVRGLL